MNTKGSNHQPVGLDSPELFAAARDFYNDTVADTTVRISCPSAEQRDRITATGERLLAALTAAAGVLEGGDRDQIALDAASKIMAEVYGSVPAVGGYPQLKAKVQLIVAQAIDAAIAAQPQGEGVPTGLPPIDPPEVPSGEA